MFSLLFSLLPLKRVKDDYLFQHLFTEPFLLLADATFLLAQASQAAVPCNGRFFAAAALVPATPHGWSL